MPPFTNFSRRDFLRLTGAAACAAAAGPGFALGAEPKISDTLTVAVPTLPNGADPTRFVGLYAQQAWSFNYDGLFDLASPAAIEEFIASGKPLDEMPVVTPNLATAYEISKDGKTYTFHLRKGVTFHNGKDFKAEDVEYCLKRVVQPAIGSSSMTKFTPVSEIKVLDDYTIRLTLQSPLAPFLSYCDMSLPIIPKGSLPIDQLQRTPPAQGAPLPPGTGPFRCVEWKPGLSLKFERFEDYREPGPYFRTVNYLRADQPIVRYTGLRTGEFDYAGGIPAPIVDKLLEGKDKKYDLQIDQGDHFIYVGTLGITQCLAFNTREAPFNDLRVRQAFNLALNRNQIAKLATAGLGAAAIQNYDQKGTSPYYIEGLTWPEQDVDEARRLLKAAGHGGGLNVEILMQNTNIAGSAGAEVMQQQLAKVGIKLKITKLTRAGFWPQARKHKFQMCYQSTGSYYTYDPDMMYDYLYSWKKTQNWRNFSGWSNERVDQLLDGARVESNTAKRLEMYKQVYEEMKKEVPIIPLMAQPGQVGLRADLKGYTIGGSIPDMRAFKSIYRA